MNKQLSPEIRAAIEAARLGRGAVSAEYPLRLHKLNRQLHPVVYKANSRARGAIVTDPLRMSPLRRAVHTNRKALWEFADALPCTGHSMGSVRKVFVGGLRAAVGDSTRRYSKGCKWKPRYGGMDFYLTLPEAYRCRVVAGVPTVFPSLSDLRKWEAGESVPCVTVQREGEKGCARLYRAEGFICGEFHGTDKASVRKTQRTYLKVRRERLREKKRSEKELAAAVRRLKDVQVTVADSLQAGNCKDGTETWMNRMHARSRMRLGALYRLVKKDTNHNTYRCALDVVRAVIRREEPGLLA